MKLAVSTLALPPGDSYDLWPRLAAQGVDAVEIAPAQLWPTSWMKLTAAEVTAAGKAAWNAGLAVVGLHDVLADRPELNPLAGPEAQRLAVACTVRAAQACRDLGGRTVNVSAGWPLALSERAALTLWREFLARVAEEIEDLDVLVCLTPRAPTATEQGLSARDCFILSTAVDHLSVGLALSAAALLPHDEMKHPTFAVIRGRLDHFRLDEPHLAEVGTADSPLDHPDLRRHLAAHRYPHWISVTQACRATVEESLAAIGRAAQFVTGAYLVGDWR